MNPHAAHSPVRTLRPVAQHFDKDGAAVVPLSPTRGLRNASVIYEKIKDLPEQTAIRADYDRHGKPYLYFPRTQKLSNQSGRDLLGAANLQADRQEALNIMLVIAQEAQAMNGVSQETRLAALRFGLKVRQRNLVGDIRVGDVRDALAVINGVERPEAGAQPVRQKGVVLRAQLGNFISMPAHLKEILAIALETGRTSGAVGSGAAVDAMFKLVQAFLDEQPRGDARAFLSHVGRYPLSADLIRFAWQWRKIKTERHSTVGFLFRQLPWAKQIDFAARVIKFIAQRVGRWQDPAHASDRRRGDSQITLVSLPKAEASSDIDVMSPLVHREASRLQPFQNPHAESSDVRVFSPLRDVANEANEADEAASTRSPSLPSPMAGRSVRADAAGTEAVDTDASLQSLLDNVEWIPLGGSESGSDPSV